MICLSLTADTIKEDIEILKKYIDYIDLAELRADYLKPEEMAFINKFPLKVDIPVILTIRRGIDGGKFTDKENRRKTLLLKGLNGRYAFVDLENDLSDTTLEAAAESSGTRVIRSFHDFKKVPDNLTGAVKSIAKKRGDIPKAAVTPKSTEDLLKIIYAFENLKNTEKILIGMGDWGFPTRILSGKFGSFLTYCSQSGHEAAPGHIDPVTLQKLYRFKNISLKTKLFGIIGNPVMHTLSPVIHNKGYAGLGMDSVYIPFQTDNIKQFLKTAEKLNINGFSVTIPHKEAIIPFLSEVSHDVKMIGSCNTVIRTGNGWKGFNTDAHGFIEPLNKALQDSSLSRLKTVVLGAGGAARAVIYALVQKGADVCILNRTTSKAKALALEFGCEYAEFSDHAAIKQADIIVQTTSIGMYPDVENDPIPDYKFSGREIVYDIVYNPEVTRFLERAKEAGCRIIKGKEMLLEQGYIQFKIFTGENYPVNTAG